MCSGAIILYFYILPDTSCPKADPHMTKSRVNLRLFRTHRKTRHISDSTSISSQTALVRLHLLFQLDNPDNTDLITDVFGLR